MQQESGIFYRGSFFHSPCERQEGEKTLEHHPFLSFNDGLEITYSDVKKRKSGSEYVVVYFEQPNESGTDFKSAQCTYPGGGFTHVVGFSHDELDKLWEHVARAGSLALEFQRSPLYA